MEEPLTPSHLLIGRRVLNLPDNFGYTTEAGDEEFTVDASQLDRRVKHLSNILNQFWKRWRTEYLTELRTSHRQTGWNCSSQPMVEVGDIVVVHDESLPRGLWKLGKIQDRIVGQDGQVRGATVKVASQNCRHSLLRRPIQLLYPLEVRSQKEGPGDEDSEDPEPETQLQGNDTSTDNPQASSDEEPRRRSQRSAAKQANDSRMACMLELEN